MIDGAKLILIRIVTNYFPLISIEINYSNMLSIQK